MLMSDLRLFVKEYTDKCNYLLVSEVIVDIFTGRNKEGVNYFEVEMVDGFLWANTFHKFDDGDLDLLGRRRIGRSLVDLETFFDECGFCVCVAKKDFVLF